MATSGLDPHAPGRPSLYETANSGNIEHLAAASLDVRQVVHDIHAFTFPADIPGGGAEVQPGDDLARGGVHGVDHALPFLGALGGIGDALDARHAAERTRANKLISVAGGGDTVAALNQAGVAGDFSYVSTAGGAFLEWMEGKPLPGVEVLRIR